MTRYIVTKISKIDGREVRYSFVEEEKAKAKIDQLDKDVRYEYTYKIEK